MHYRIAIASQERSDVWLNEKLFEAIFGMKIIKKIFWLKPHRFHNFKMKKFIPM